MKFGGKPKHGMFLLDCEIRFLKTLYMYQVPWGPHVYTTYSDLTFMQGHRNEEKTKLTVDISQKHVFSQAKIHHKYYVQRISAIPVLMSLSFMGRWFKKIDLTKIPTPAFLKCYCSEISQTCADQLGDGLHKLFSPVIHTASTDVNLWLMVTKLVES